MEPPQTRVAWEGDLDGLYDRAVQEWLALEPGPEAQALYQARIFPLTCERIRRVGRTMEPLDLLYVPVGTQAFAPTLAVLANPARCVALLESKESAPHGALVERALARETGAIFLHVPVEETRMGEIARAIRDVFDARALPDGSRVGADITGGTKVMTSAVAGVGSLYGWRLVYVAGVFERAHGGLSHHERVQVLENVLDVFGARRREVARTLLLSGACEAARRAFLTLAFESGDSGSDRGYAALAEAASGLRQADPKTLRRALKGAARRLGVEVPEPVQAFLQEAAAEPAPGEGGGPRPERAALAWLGARVCMAEDQPLAALGLAHLAAAGLKLPAPPGAPLRDMVRLLTRRKEWRRRREALAWLDAQLGRGLAERVAALK